MSDVKHQQISQRHSPQRRNFLKCVLPGTLGAAGMAAGLAHFPTPAMAAPVAGTLQVWSCGGLAEAMLPANRAFEAETGVSIAYTGAFAAALGKSLLGSGRTEVFAGRVLELAKKLRGAGRMQSFMPLCYTSYVIVTPRGNPAGITSVEDMAKPGVRVAMAEQASPPGGAAVIGLLKKSGFLEKVKANLVENGTCVQRSVELVCRGKADAMITELRVPRMELFAPHLDVVEIPAEFFPPGPLTFTIGIMEEARNPQLAMAYSRWMAGEKGAAFWEKAGFIPACSPAGRVLTEKYRVQDA